jgi:hypothetical protein
MKHFGKKLKVYLLLISILICNNLFAQQSIVFERTYRAETIDTAIMVRTGVQTSDGGYLLGGYASYGMFLSQMLFFKIDSLGNYQWKKMYGSLPCSGNSIRRMQELDDGTILVCGSGTFSTEGAPNDLKPMNSMIMRIDEEANIIWHKEFVFGTWEGLNTMAISDTGFICAGGRLLANKSNNAVTWVTGNFDGSIFYEHFYVLGTSSQTARGVTQLPDGNFLIAGMISGDSFILKVNPFGVVIDSLILSGNEVSNQIFNIAYANKIIICGAEQVAPMTNEIYAYHGFLEDNLNNIDFVYYEHENELRYSYSQKIITHSDNSFLVAGSKRTPHRKVDFWLKKFDSNNELLWQRYIGGDDYESFHNIIKTNDNGYLIIAESLSFDENLAIYLVKTDSLGLGNYTSQVESYIVNKNDFTIYPNPASDIVYVEFDNKNLEYIIEIYDISGRQVLQNKSNNPANHLNISNLKNGLYTVMIYHNNRLYQNKLIINR